MHTLGQYSARDRNPLRARTRPAESVSSAFTSFRDRIEVRIGDPVQYTTGDRQLVMPLFLAAIPPHQAGWKRTGTFANPRRTIVVMMRSLSPVGSIRTHLRASD